MNTKLKLGATALLLGWALTGAQAAPIISPFASDLGPGAYSADAAAGGSAQSAFNGGYWNAGSHGTHWIQADMGASFTLSEVRFAIDVLPFSNTFQNIYLSDTPIGFGYGALTPVAGRSGFTTQYQQFSVLFPTPATGRYLQVVSNGGASWTAIGDGGPRSNWVDTQGGPANGGNVPEPSGLVLTLSALGLLGAARKLRS